MTEEPRRIYPLPALDEPASAADEDWLQRVYCVEPCDPPEHPASADGWLTNQALVDTGIGLTPTRERAQKLRGPAAAVRIRAIADTDDFAANATRTLLQSPGQTLAEMLAKYAPAPAYCTRVVALRLQVFVCEQPFLDAPAAGVTAAALADTAAAAASGCGGSVLLCGVAMHQWHRACRWDFEVQELLRALWERDLVLTYDAVHCSAALTLAPEAAQRKLAELIRKQKRRSRQEQRRRERCLARANAPTGYVQRTKVSKLAYAAHQEILSLLTLIDPHLAHMACKDSGYDKLNLVKLRSALLLFDTYYGPTAWRALRSMKALMQEWQTFYPAVLELSERSQLVVTRYRLCSWLAENMHASFRIRTLKPRKAVAY